MTIRSSALKVLGAALLALALPAAARAQVLATAETGGKGSKGLLVTASGLAPEGLRLFNAYAEFGYGLTDRIDALVGYGNISALGRTQHYALAGGNFRISKREHTFVDLSSFDVVAVPFTKRREGSTALLTAALVASRPVKLGAKTWTPYSGVNFTVPIGAIRDKLFSPPETLVNVPIGISTGIGKKWVFYGEVDAGPNLKAAGVGLLLLF